MTTPATNSKTRGAKGGASYANVACGNPVKPSGKDPQQPDMVPTGLAELQETLQKAMGQMASFSGTLATLQSDVTEVKTTQGKIKTDVAAIFQRLDEAEARISDLEDEKERLEQGARASAKECAELRDTVSDMANRERRFNVRLFGLREKPENNIKLRERVKQLFVEALGVDLAESELQLVHRSVAKMPAEGAPPRPVIVRFHSFLERERVLAATRAKARQDGGLQWGDSKLSLFPDMTKDVVEKRKQFADARRKLHELDVRFTLAYPAVLRFTWKGERVSFADPRKAMQLLSGGTETGAA